MDYASGVWLYKIYKRPKMIQNRACMQTIPWCAQIHFKCGSEWGHGLDYTWVEEEAEYIEALDEARING